MDRVYKYDGKTHGVYTMILVDETEARMYFDKIGQSDVKYGKNAKFATIKQAFDSKGKREIPDDQIILLVIIDKVPGEFKSGKCPCFDDDDEDNSNCEHSVDTVVFTLYCEDQGLNGHSIESYDDNCNLDGATMQLSEDIFRMATTHVHMTMSIVIPDYIECFLYEVSD